MCPAHKRPICLTAASHILASFSRSCLRLRLVFFMGSPMFSGTELVCSAPQFDRFTTLVTTQFETEGTPSTRVFQTLMSILAIDLCRYGSVRKHFGQTIPSGFNSGCVPQQGQSCIGSIVNSLPAPSGVQNRSHFDIRIAADNSSNSSAKSRSTSGSQMSSISA